MRIRYCRSLFTLTVVLAMGLLTLACSMFGIRSEEEPNYQVILEEDDKEIRQYIGFIVAKTLVRSDYDEGGRIAFRRLFNYISGSNTKNETISMTAPVIQEKQGTAIAMTAPVVQEETEEGWVMSFVMPEQFTMESIPAPVDTKVKLEQVPGKKVAVRRYTGTTSEQTINKLGAELQEWSMDNGFRAVSKPRSARYDPPWTIPFLRRSEIHIDVTQLNGKRES